MLLRAILVAVPFLAAFHLVPAMPLSELFTNSTDYHQLQRRADTKACSNLPFDYFIRRSALNLNMQTGPNDCKATNTVLGGRGYQLPAATGSRREFQVSQNDNYKAMTNLEIGTVGPGTHTCDHVVEVEAVKKVLEKPGGVCDQAKRLLDDANGDPVKVDKIKGNLNNIVGKVNGPENLIFLQRSVESVKGDMVNWVQGLTPNPVSIRFSRDRKKVVTYSGGKGFWLPGGLLDYLNDKPASVGSTVAAAIDEIVKRDFPAAATSFGVRHTWENEYVKPMKRELQKVQRAAADAIGAAACDTSTGASGSFTRRTTLRELPVSKLYFSLTTRAAVSRVKSGPKAPPGRSCPMKIVPQKQVVPRSQVKAKAKPATKPRSPSTQPRSQPSSPRKRVVPRTADRPKRVAGQPAKKKKATLRIKPRVVPKPTKRPRGKPRTHRRR